MKVKLLHLDSPQPQKSHNACGTQCILHTFSLFGCATLAHLPSNLKATVLSRGRQEKALQQVQALVQAGLPVEPYDLGDPLVLEVAVADRDAVWSLWQSLRIL